MYTHIQFYTEPDRQTDRQTDRQADSTIKVRPSFASFLSVHTAIADDCGLQSALCSLHSADYLIRTNEACLSLQPASTDFACPG